MKELLLSYAKMIAGIFRVFFSLTGGVLVNIFFETVLPDLERRK